MDQKTTRVAELLREAGELHHAVYRITDGAHDDWPLWYAEWLLELSELPEILGSKPTRSDLVYLLVKLGKDYDAAKPDQEWPDYYAVELVRHYGT